MAPMVLGLWTLLLIGICVWAGMTQESDQTLDTEGEPDWSEQPVSQAVRHAG